MCLQQAIALCRLERVSPGRVHPGTSESSRQPRHARKEWIVNAPSRRGGRAALYLRVSTETQACENQRPDLESIAASRGLQIVATYEEQISALKARPAYEKMRNDAHRGRFDVLLIWAIDRFGRSMTGNLEALLELDRRGVQVVSAREPWLDTGGPVRPLLIAIFSWCAEQERARLIERTKSGLERARREGKRLGRPPEVVDIEKAREMRAQGLSFRAVSRNLGVAAATIQRALRGAE